MKGQIAKTGHVWSTDSVEFYEGVMKIINDFQASPLIVETQYSTQSVGNTVIYSALIHARNA